MRVKAVMTATAAGHTWWFWRQCTPEAPRRPNTSSRPGWTHWRTTTPPCTSRDDDPALHVEGMWVD